MTTFDRRPGEDRGPGEAILVMSAAFEELGGMPIAELRVALGALAKLKTQPLLGASWLEIAGESMSARRLVLNPPSSDWVAIYLTDGVTCWVVAVTSEDLEACIQSTVEKLELMIVSGEPPMAEPLLNRLRNLDDESARRIAEIRHRQSPDDRI